MRDKNLVDAVERKRLVARKAIEIIAAEGLNRVTVRRLAAELGFSTQSITHYFKDKNQLLDWICEYKEEAGYSHYSEPLEHGSVPLVDCLVAMTAIDPTNRVLWKVYIAFWDQSARDVHFASKLERWINRANVLVAGLIARRNPQQLDCAGCALQLIALVTGISVQILLQPDTWTEGAVREAIARHVVAILGPSDELQE